MTDGSRLSNTMTNFVLTIYTKAFRHVFGSEYLPDLYRVWSEHPEGNVVTLEYDHIEGEQFPPVVIDEHGSRLINKTMKMIALKVIPDFIEFSKSHMNAPMVYIPHRPEDGQHPNSKWETLSYRHRLDGLDTYNISTRNL